jgi:hypothetical protein
MIRTLRHDPDDPAEVAAIQTPEGEPDAELIDPDSLPEVDPLQADDSVAPE